MRPRARFVGLMMLVAMAAGPVRAQSVDRVYRLGHLSDSQLSETFTRELMLPELAKLGFVEGRNLLLEGRAGDVGAAPRLMRELLETRPDAIVAIGAVIPIAGAATRKVPIVTLGGDPVELGLAANYARPGGNVTGVVILASDLDVKRLQLLQQAAPERRRIAALLRSNIALSNESALRAAASSAGIELLPFHVATPADYPAAFAAMRAARAEALVIGAWSVFNRDAKILTALALEARLPTVCEWAEMAREGCMLGYGPSHPALRRRMADQVARIFRGVPPGEIAIEQPTLFDFAVNLKVAKALGVALPPVILGQSDEVIE